MNVEDTKAFENAFAEGAEPRPGQTISPYFAQRLLLALRVKEKSLLVDFGRDHPAVKNVRQRIELVTEFIRQHPCEAPVSSPRPTPAAVIQASVASGTTADHPATVPTTTPALPVAVPGNSAVPQPFALFENQVLAMPLAIPDNRTVPDLFALTDNQIGTKAFAVPDSRAIPNFMAAKSAIENVPSQPGRGAEASPPAPTVCPTHRTQPSAHEPATTQAPLLKQQSEPEPHSALQAIAAGPLFSVAVALFAGVLVHLTGLIFLWHRFGRRWTGPVGAQAHATVAGAQPPAGGPLPDTTRPQPATALSQDPNVNAAGTEAHVRQEQSVLKQVFEHNVMLRTQLAELSSRPCDAGRTNRTLH